jgi:flagellar basal body-associated protein FliL
MKRILAVLIMILMVIILFNGLLVPVMSDNGNTEQPESTRNAEDSSRSNYIAYYNKTFSIDKDWEADNVSVVIFVQTQDQTQKSKETGGSSGTFKSAEVLQSTIDFLTGEEKRTACCRHVFFELITATWCGNCPAADGAFDRMLRNSTYFPGKLTGVEIHPSSSGDFYNTDSLARHNWYSHGNSHPTAIFDGLYCLTGGNSNPNSTNLDSRYKTIYDNRQPVLPKIDLITFGNKTKTSGWINLSIELLSPTPLRNLKVHFWVVEDVYPYQTGHNAYLRHTLRDALIPEDFTPPNHPPKIKGQLSDVNMLEDTSDSTSIWLRPSFEDEDLDVLTYHSNQDGGNKRNISIEIDDEGNVTLTPDNNWNGVEDIIFYANDGLVSSPGIKVKVTVDNVNDAPILANPIYDFTMNEDVPVDDKINLSHVFYDVDMDTVLNSNPQEPLLFGYSGNENIQVTIKNDGWVVLDPEPNWNGNETITFTAKDSGGESVWDNVKIWVRSGNDPPILSKSLPTTTIDEDETVKDFLDLYDYFVDPDGDALTFDFIPNNNLKIKLKNSLVSITPYQDYWGSEIVTFTASDLPGSEPMMGNMTVVINSINDPPILNDTNNWVIKSGDVQSAGNKVQISQDDEVKLIITAYDPADNDVIIFSDDTELFNINSASGEISFTPTNDDVGTHEIKIKIDDRQETDSQVEKTFTFMIENVNDPPETPQILSPTDGNTYTSSKEIRFTGESDDPDMYIPDSTESLVFEWTTGKSSETLSFDKDFSTKLEAGEHIITLTVRDRKGAESSADISIVVDIDKTLDTDSDGTPDYLDEDDDNDGMLDEWEEKYPEHLDSKDPTDANSDPDKDTFTNLEEYLGNDGVPGGEDSTNPILRSSHPKDESKGEDNNDNGALSNGFVIGGIVGVIIVVLLLLFLFFFMKKRKKPEKKGPASAESPPQTQQTVTQNDGQLQPQTNLVPSPIPQTGQQFPGQLQPMPVNMPMMAPGVQFPPDNQQPGSGLQQQK